MWLIIGYILTGLLAGTISGLIGIGGGVIIVPILIFIFGLSQKEAQGTTLALLVPPIGLLGAWAYWKQELVHIDIAIWIIIGFFFGCFMGSKFAIYLPAAILKRVFGVIMLLISLKLIFGR